jgi:hypothetical protein
MKDEGAWRVTGGGCELFDAAKQPGIPNRFSIGVGLHSSKQKLALTRKAAWELTLWAEAALGYLDCE